MEGEFQKVNRSQLSHGNSRRRSVARHNRTRPEIFVIDCENGENYDDDSVKPQPLYRKTTISKRNPSKDRKGI